MERDETLGYDWTPFRPTGWDGPFGVNHLEQTKVAPIVLDEGSDMRVVRIRQD